MVTLEPNKAKMHDAILEVIDLLRTRFADDDGEFDDPDIAEAVTILVNSLP